jgi:hypothetical protein
MLSIPEVVCSTVNFPSFAISSDSLADSAASDAFFGVFHHPTNENRIAALFIPSSGRFADMVARKITHYGKYSYLAFQSGKNRDKGVWSVEKSPLIYEWD